MALKINDNVVISDDRTLKNISSANATTSSALKNILSSTGGIQSYDSLGAVPVDLDNGTLFYVIDEKSLKIYDSATGGRIQLAKAGSITPSTPGEIRGDISNISVVNRVPTTGKLTIGDGGHFDDSAGNLPSAVSINSLLSQIGDWSSNKGGLTHWNTSRKYTDSDGNTFGQMIFVGYGTVNGYSGTARFLTAVRVDDSGGISFKDTYLNSTASGFDTRTLTQTSGTAGFIDPMFADGWDSSRDKKIIAMKNPTDQILFIDMTNPDSIGYKTIADHDSSRAASTFRGIDWNPNIKALVANDDRVTQSNGPGVFQWDSSGNFMKSPDTTRYLKSTQLYVNSSNSVEGDGPVCWISDTHFLVMNGGTNTSEKGKVFQWLNGLVYASHFVTFSSTFQYCTFAKCDRDKNVLYLGDRNGFYVISGAEFTKLSTGVGGNVSLGSFKYYGPSTQSYMFAGHLFKDRIDPNIDGAIISYNGGSYLGHRALAAIDGSPNPNSTYGNGDTSFTTDATGNKLLDIVNGYALTYGYDGSDVGFATLKGAE